MLVVVAGSLGFDQVLGVSSTDRTALLEAVRSRVSEHIIVLAPQHATTTVREQAHVLVAAFPRTHVCVLPFDHHALTLTLIAAEALTAIADTASETDPGAVVQLLQQSAARSRSLIWHPKVQGLAEPAPTATQLISSLVRSPGFFVELGTGADAGLLPGRSGSPLGAEGRLYSAGGTTPLLQTQLQTAVAVPTPITVETSRPYATRGSIELTLLVAAPHPPYAADKCPNCAAGLVADECVFCGRGPRAGLTASRSTTTRSRGDQPELVGASGTTTPGGVN